MSDSLDDNLAGGFQELLPWADPYIAALIEKLRTSPEFADADVDAVDELPPPLESDNPAGDEAWQADWSPRNWPRET